MKIYLKPDGANWKLYEGDYKELAQEWGKLGIEISASASIGAGALRVNGERVARRRVGNAPAGSEPRQATRQRPRRTPTA